MSGSNGIYDSSKIGGGIASWWGGSMKDRNDYTSKNMPSDVAKGLVRFDGTGYFANGNLWWDNSGKLHADPLSFFVGPENVGDLLSIFQIVKSGTSINYVVPRYPFQKLSISSYLELGSGYRIKVDEANNAIYVEKDGGGIVNFYATGGITALGVGTKSPQTILDALPIDTNTLSKEGGKLTVIGGGSGGNTGAISLNGQRYDSVDGVITLPNLKLAEPTTFSLTDRYVAVRTPNRTADQYYEFWDTIGGWAFLAAKGVKLPEGTSSQFLKADGSVDGNLYALAYEGNKQQTFISRYLAVVDKRNEAIIPSTMDKGVNAYFTIQDTPYSNWRSTLSVKGWASDYASWELTGPSHNNDTKANERLYYRYGFNSSWKTGWKPLAFLEDISNVADVYFNGQYIYVDYGYWVVGLVRIGDASLDSKFISGEMMYRRSNGLYGNGSVRFNLIKKFNSTNVFAGVLYNGCGIDTGQDAPKLCTFTYNGVKWAGLKWSSVSSLDSIKTIIYDNSSTDTPFYILYARSSGSDVINAEIKNSVSELGSDIDVQPISTNGRIYTSADRLEIDNITNGWAYVRYRTNSKYFDVGLSGTTAGMDGAGNFEIRPDGSNNKGIFVRHSGSSYGKLGVVSKDTQECSISYFNNAPIGNYATWTVGTGIINATSFDWWYANTGIKMTMDSDGKLFVNRKSGDAPNCSLAIGDHDTGLNQDADGIIAFRSNGKQAGFWGYTNGRLFNCYFREPSGVTYEKASLMINGNGSTISPSIGFHQPGVVGCHLELDNEGNFRFKDSSGYRNIYANKLIGEADKSIFLVPNYLGGQQANPQTYFNNSMGVKVAMTGIGWSGQWGDTLWINGYSGGDVLPMCTLHFIRNGTPRFGISSQNSNGTSYGTNYEVWTAYNSNKAGVNWSARTFFAEIGLKSRNICIETDNSGNNGGCSSEINNWNAQLYLQHKSNTNIIACTGGGNFVIGSTNGAYDTTYKLNVAGDIRATSWIRTDGDTGWYSQSYGGGIHMTDSTYVRVYNNKSFYVSGNILATGGITAKTTSDMRLKNRVGQIDYAKKLLSLGLVFDYIYNNTAQSRIGKMVDDKRHIGLSYQAVSKILPTICGKDDDGYGYINYISPDFISLIAGATQLNTLGIKELCKKTNSIEDEIKKLKKENECLKKEINKLKREYR